MTNQNEISPDYYQNLFTRWTTDQNVLPDFPNLKSEQLVALHFIMMAFEEDVEYTERQIDDGIIDRNIFSIDHIQIRVFLVTFGFLEKIFNQEKQIYHVSNKFLKHGNWNSSIPGISN